MSRAYSGFGTIPAELLARKDLSSTAKVILVIIARFGRPENPCNLTHAQLAERVGVCRSTATRVVNSLAAQGWIRLVPRPLPLPRHWSRCGYLLVESVMRQFFRAWAVISPRLKRWARTAADWLTLDLWPDLGDGEPRGAPPPAETPPRLKSSKRPVRRANPALQRRDPPTFQQVLEFTGLAPDFQKGVDKCHHEFGLTSPGLLAKLTLGRAPRPQVARA